MATSKNALSQGKMMLAGGYNLLHVWREVNTWHWSWSGVGTLWGWPWHRGLSSAPILPGHQQGRWRAKRLAVKGDSSCYTPVGEDRKLTEAVISCQFCSKYSMCFVTHNSRVNVWTMKCSSKIHGFYWAVVTVKLLEPVVIVDITLLGFYVHFSKCSGNNKVGFLLQRQGFLSVVSPFSHCD